ncbi:ferredoxin-type protein NapF [Pasteurellaceae bacterium LFhippo2]|nr:ferredoxin-type protein NapF [Pasteurellaceae bacterium LFhippo2]
MTNLTDNALPRRSFLRGHFLNSLKTEQVKQQGHSAIRPPWSNLANFLEKCTACDKCISACEMGILTRGAGGYPEVNFSLGRKECSFCEDCVKVCEADVFRDTSEEAWLHKVVIQPSCLAQMNVECRSCEDSCESRAIRFKRQVGGIAKPELDLTACNGCGACLSVCPTNAITIQLMEQQ